MKIANVYAGNRESVAYSNTLDSGVSSTRAESVSNTGIECPAYAHRVSRNCVLPSLGLAILNAAQGKITRSKNWQDELWLSTEVIHNDKLLLESPEIKRGA